MMENKIIILCNSVFGRECMNCKIINSFVAQCEVPLGRCPSQSAKQITEEEVKRPWYYDIEE
jgi:hypothetical protein